MRKVDASLLSVIFWLAAGVVLFYPLPSSSQTNTIRFNHLDTRRGLSHNSVYSIIQDRKGFVWIGTYEGLNKFDGYQFTVYPRPGDSLSPAIGPISALAEDREGFLWLGTLRGEIFRFDPDKEIFQLCDDAQVPRWQPVPIYRICIDKSGNIWSYLRNSVCHLKADKKHIWAEPVWSNTRKNEEISGLNLDDSNTIWIGTHLYCYKLDISRPDKVIGADTIFTGGTVTYDIVRQGNKLWLSTLSGLIHYNPANGKQEKFYWRNINKDFPYFHLSIKAQDGSLWFGSVNSGLYTFDTASGQFQQFTYDPLLSSSISSDQIGAMCELASGDIWIGTPNGINIITRNSLFFRNYSFFNTYKKPKPVGVSPIYEDKSGKVWIGTMGGGLRSLDPSGNNVEDKPFYPDKNESGAYPLNHVYSIYPAGENALWIGGARYLALFDKKSRKVTRYYYPQQEGAKQFSVWAVLKDHWGKYWVGSRWNLSQFDSVTGKYTIIDYRGDSTSYQESIWCIYEDRKHNLWIGTSAGLTRIIRGPDGSILSFKTYVPRRYSKISMAVYDVFYIHPDARGHLWLTTTQESLNCFDPEKETFTSYTVNDGLPANAISGILEDKSGKLWVSTINGLCLFDPIKGKAIASFYEDDGLQNNHFNFKSCYKGRNGEMYFGGLNGLTVFNPEKLNFNTYKAPLAITSFKVLYKESKNIIKKDRITEIPYSENSISFEYASLDFANPLKKHFWYILEGFDKDWINAGRRHFVNYTNIPPGDYVFRLRETDAEGKLIRAQLAVPLRITRPYYLQWWYRLGFAVFLLGLIGTAAFFLFRQANEKRKRLQSELSALRSQLNPHFVFNSLNSLQHYIIDNQQRLALEYLSKFAQLMRMILENSRRDSISIEDEMKFLELYLYMEAARFSNRFDFRIQMDQSISSKQWRIPSMLIQPLVENSIIHGLVPSRGKGKISVTFRKEEEYIVCTVEDNGIGRQLAAQQKVRSIVKHNSLGATILAERIAALNKSKRNAASLEYYDLTDDGGEVRGTRVEVKMPVM